MRRASADDREYLRPPSHETYLISKIGEAQVPLRTRPRHGSSRVWPAGALLKTLMSSYGLKRRWSLNRTKIRVYNLLRIKHLAQPHERCRLLGLGEAVEEFKKASHRTRMRFPLLLESLNRGSLALATDPSHMVRDRTRLNIYLPLGVILCPMPATAVCIV